MTYVSGSGTFFTKKLNVLRLEPGGSTASRTPQLVFRREQEKTAGLKGSEVIRTSGLRSLAPALRTVEHRRQGLPGVKAR